MLKRIKGHQTRKNALNLLQLVLDQAVERGLLQVNPARDKTIKFKRRATDKDDLEGILTPDEQQRLLAAVPARDRDVVLFALFGGCRQSSQWWLKRADCHNESCLLRKHKSGKPRRLYMLEPARLALLRAIERTSPVRGSHGKKRFQAEWAFASPRGYRRSHGKAPLGWATWVKTAKIDHHVRWHDLRHTCATSLLAGWWGDRKWSLDEVCRYLGHSSVKVTERYARKLEETQRLAVAATVFPASSLFLLPIANAAENERCGSDSNRRITVLQCHDSASDSTGLSRPGNSWGNGSARPAMALALAAAELALRPRVHMVTVVRRRRQEVG